MNEVKCERECDKPSDETFFLLSTSLNSISSSLFAATQSTSTYVSDVNSSQYTDIATPSTPPPPPSTITSTIASDQRNNRPTCVGTNTMALSKSTAIVHTCCYKHRCQLSACHINNGEIQASASKKLLLSVPLQRKRKKVVYNRDFCGAIGIDIDRNSTLLDLTNDQRCLVITHYSCVEKLTRMCTPAAVKDSMGQIKISADIGSSADDEHMITSEMISCDGRQSTRKCDSNLRENLKVQRMSSASPMSDEGLANASPYCSSGEEEDARTHEKVERSCSSDSALGLDDEILAGMADLSPRNQQRRMTLTVTDIPLRAALLPVAEPTTLPDSPLSPAAPIPDFVPTNIQTPVVVPSKMILEARIVEIPAQPSMPAQQSDSKNLSRRESCVSDTTTEDIPHVRFVRTPSVVVSDYSDDILCGITLEELEFFRQQRKSSLGTPFDSARSSATDNSTDYLSDISAASSCSNLNYCGSTISLLDENYTSMSGIPTPERKLSSCSTCSTGQEDNEDLNEVNQFSNNLIEALQQQQRQKKVCKCSLAKASSQFPPNEPKSE